MIRSACLAAVTAALLITSASFAAGPDARRTPTGARMPVGPGGISRDANGNPVMNRTPSGMQVDRATAEKIMQMRQAQYGQQQQLRMQQYEQLKAADAAKKTANDAVRAERRAKEAAKKEAAKAARQGKK